MRINKLELQNSLTEWNYKTNLLKNLSIISVISRGYRFCNFLQQIGHFTDIIILRFHYREQQIMKMYFKSSLTELTEFVGYCVLKLILISRRRKPGLMLVLWISFSKEITAVRRNIQAGDVKHYRRYFFSV